MSDSMHEPVNTLSRRRKGIKGVVYLGNIPHGFFEPQIRSFFTQFGHVRRLRLSRSKKTGGSKGYAYIQFAHQVTADVVASTMNNYLMFNRLLRCEVIAREVQHPELFKGCSTKFSKPRFHIIAARRHDSFKSASNEARRLKRKDLKMKKLNAKLLDFGILPPTGDEDLRSTIATEHPSHQVGMETSL